MPTFDLSIRVYQQSGDPAGVWRYEYVNPPGAARPWFRPGERVYGCALGWERLWDCLSVTLGQALTVTSLEVQ